MEPPVFSQPRSPFDELREEHVALLVDVRSIHGSVRGLTQPQDAALGGASLLRDSLDIFYRRLRMHFRREEEGAYPDAQRMVSAGAQGADVFGRFFAEEAEEDMGAHAALSRRVNEMIEIAGQLETGASLDEAAARQLLALANLTASLLERHAAKEDTLIFPMIERALTPAQVDQVRERLRALGSDRDLTGGHDTGLSQLGV